MLPIEEKAIEVVYHMHGSYLDYLATYDLRRGPVGK